MIDDEEQEERDAIETERQRVNLQRNIAYTWIARIGIVTGVCVSIMAIVLTFVTIWYIIPAAKEFKESNEQAAKNYREFIPDLKETFKEKNKAFDDTMVNVRDTTANSKEVLAEVHGLVVDTRQRYAPTFFKSMNGLSTTSIKEIEKTGIELRSLIKNGNERVFGDAGLMIALTDTTTRAGDMVSNQDKVLQAIGGEATGLVSELRQLVASDEWKEMRAQLLETSKNVNNLSKHTDETVIESRDIVRLVKTYIETYAPGILASLEKISKETSKYQKLALLANIFRLLAIGLGAL